MKMVGSQAAVRSRFQWLGLLLTATLSTSAQGEAANVRRNVLFVMSDDLRPELNTYYTPGSQTHPHMHTPNIDALAARSLQLMNAHVQYSICGPSRTSFLTSRRPHTTNVFKNSGNFRLLGNPDIVTLPQYFKSHGYRVVNIGKVFHPGVEDYPMSWSEPVWHAPNRDHAARTNISVYVTDAENTENPLAEEQLADYAITRLREFAPKANNGEENFFMGLGFYKPHPPFTCPERLLKYYPPGDIALPSNKYAPAYMPEVGWSYMASVTRARDLQELGYHGEINETLPDWKTLDLRRAYYCTVTYVDEQLGRIMKELDDLGLAQSTVVTFAGDHGWMLGEHSMWAKHMNFEIATRSPLMLHVPGMTEGSTRENLVEFVDLMPTVIEAAGFPAVPACPRGQSRNVNLCTEGRSLLPLIGPPQKEVLNWRQHAYSQVYRSERQVQGYAVQTDRHRYTEWVAAGDGPEFLPVWADLQGVELYDHLLDPEENLNVASNPEYADICTTLKGKLRETFPTGSIASVNFSYSPFTAVVFLIAFWG